MLLSPNLFMAVTGPKHFQGQSFIIGGKYFGLAAGARTSLREGILSRVWVRIRFFDSHIPVTRIIADQ